MPLDYLHSLIPSNIESIFMVILILVFGLFLGSMANRAVNLALSRTKLEGLAAAFLARAARIAIYVVAVISALGTLGVDTTSLIAALGAAGLAVGLALRDTLSNLAAGLILAFNGAFRQGDIRTGARAFAANINDICTLLHQARGMSTRAGPAVKLPTIRKTIWCGI